MTEEQKKKLSLKVGALILVLLGGILIGTQFSKAPEVRTVEVEKNAEAWRELKAIDDEGFKVARTQIELCTGAMYAASQGDTGTLTAIEAQVTEEAGKSGEIVNARQRVLKELGY